MPDHSTEKTRFSDKIALINQMLQIAAIIVGGSWALWTWWSSAYASLSTGLYVNGEAISKWDPSYKACYVTITTKIENLGQSSISVAHVKYNLFKFAPVELSSNETIKYLGFNVQDAQPEGGGEFDGEYLDIAYPPKQSAEDDLHFLIDSDLKGRIWIKTEAFGKDNRLLGMWENSIDPCEKAKSQK